MAGTSKPLEAYFYKGGVFTLVKKFKSVTEVATEYGTTANTIKRHINQIYDNDVVLLDNEGVKKFITFTTEDDDIIIESPQEEVVEPKKVSIFKKLLG